LPPIRDRFEERIPQIVVVILVFIIAILLLSDTLEDVLIEGNSFAGTPFGVIFSILISFVGSFTVTIQSWGYAGIFVLMTLESSSLPIPSEVILPFAGYLVSQGLLNFWLVILVSTVAGILGSLIDYYVGLKGTNILARRKTVQKLLYDQGRMDTAEIWFKKYGAPAVFLCRLIPGFRTLISFPAGALKMPLARFITYTTIGCLIWNIVLVSIGVYVGANWREVTSTVRYLIIIIAIIAVVIVLLWLIRRKHKHASK
jgi:membrane protein DedA with SNARE-associated domain